MEKKAIVFLINAWSVFLSIPLESSIFFAVVRCTNEYDVQIHRAVPSYVFFKETKRSVNLMLSDIAQLQYTARGNYYYIILGVSARIYAHGT